MARRKRKGRSDKGGGSITLLPNGKYRVDVEIPTRPGNPRRRKSRTVASRAAAVIARRELLNSIEVGIEAVVPDILLTDWIDSRHALYAGRSVAPEVIESHERCGRLHIKPHLQGVKVADLTRQHIETLLQTWIDKGVGNRTQEIAYNVLWHAVEDARSAGILRGNPLDRIRRPTSKRTDVDPFSREQVQVILEAADGRKLGPLWTILFLTGMRFGEAAALRWESVDLQSRQLRIERTGKYHKREFRERQPKTDRSRRIIVLPKQVAESLANLPRHLDCDNVFFNRAGKPHDISVVRRVWKRLLRDAGVSHRPLHQTRHTYATLTLTAGVPVHIVSAVLGHSSPATTLNLYSHYLPSHQDVAVAAAENLLIG